MQNERTPTTAKPTSLTAPVGGCEAPDWGEVYRRMVVYFQTSFRFGGFAEDAAQETIVKLLRAEPRRDRTRPFLPWCYRVARNHAVDLLRRNDRAAQSADRSSSVDSVESIGAPPGDLPEVALERDEAVRDVGAYLEGLDETDRELAYLRFFEELPYREIARITGRVSGTIRYRIHTIRKGLAEYLKGQGYDEIE